MRNECTCWMLEIPSVILTRVTRSCEEFVKGNHGGNCINPHDPLLSLLLFSSFSLSGMGLISRYGVVCVAQVGVGCSMAAGNASIGKLVAAAVSVFLSFFFY